VLRTFFKHNDAQVVAICDVHDLHYRDLDWGSGEAFGRKPTQKLIENHYSGNKAGGTYTGCSVYADYRELIVRDDLNAVIIATPDHWHAIIALAALRQGLDIYCEKPLTHFFAEGQMLYREVAKQQAVFQVGSQQRSDFKFRQGVELVRNGLIGRVKRVEVGLPRGYTKLMGDSKVVPTPEGLDYEFWCGPGPVLPYMRARHHRWWRGHRGYGGGSLMDFIGHHNDIAHWGIDVDHSGPERVEAVGWTRLESDLYNTPVDYEIRCEYPGKIETAIGSKFDAGLKWIGETGWVKVARGNIEASDDHWLEQKFDRGPWKAHVSSDHARNFLDCAKSRKACIAPAETGHRSVTPGHLGYVSYDLGRPLRWDAKKEEIIGDPEAQAKLIAMSHRKPWQLGQG
jgi:predicted dehydrogenase